MRIQLHSKREQGVKELGCVVSQRELILHKVEWKRNRKRIVFAHGSFDLLHPGHIRLLEQARALGDILVVGVRGDAAVRAIHARENQRDPARPASPIMPASERAEILAALAAVDFVVICDSAEPHEILGELQPDIAVEGARDSSEASSSKNSAGTPPSPVFIPLEPGYSTARLIERIQQLRA
jgi:rfaE bifunctional protein nucleotidyltransferase chain/domain